MITEERIRRMLSQESTLSQMIYRVVSETTYKRDAQYFLLGWSKMCVEDLIEKYPKLREKTEVSLLNKSYVSVLKEISKQLTEKELKAFLNEILPYKLSGQIMNLFTLGYYHRWYWGEFSKEVKNRFSIEISNLQNSKQRDVYIGLTYTVLLGK
jgi:hypothetical protein